MILGSGLPDRPLLGPSTYVHRDPPPRPDPPVQGVVVNPPRDTRVAVRVEIVTEPHEAAAPAPAEDATAGPSAPAYEPWRDLAWFSAAYASAAAEVQPMAAAVARFGAPDGRYAASAYRTQADWQQASSSSGEGYTAPRVSVRA